MHCSKVLADFRLQPTSKTFTVPDKQRTEHQQALIKISPLLQKLPFAHLSAAVLSLLQLLAGVKRYSEKLLRGYYWEQFRSLTAGVASIRNSSSERAKPAVSLKERGE
jgi:hypothetical protein